MNDFEEGGRFFCLKACGLVLLNVEFCLPSKPWSEEDLSRFPNHYYTIVTVSGYHN